MNYNKFLLNFYMSKQFDGKVFSQTSPIFGTLYFGTNYLKSQRARHLSKKFGDTFFLFFPFPSRANSSTYVSLLYLYVYLVYLCIHYLPICISFLSICISFLSICISFLSICISFLSMYTHTFSLSLFIFFISAASIPFLSFFRSSKRTLIAFRSSLPTCSLSRLYAFWTLNSKYVNLYGNVPTYLPTYPHMYETSH